MTTREAKPNPESYKRPESVLVVIYTRDGEVLLLQRADSTQAWQSVTGSMHWNEKQPIEAARRELFEETGLAADNRLIETGIHNCYPIHPLWKPRYHPDTHENCEHLFFLELPERLAIAINTKEHQDFCWVPFEEAIGKVRFSTNRDAIELLLKNRS
ncbi:MAG: dihydroneopterin triphosphate diphosphatase [Acidiferrobacterales bacterium]|nr:dihydroneopterin triphosphate diphosphatase [Acidiferrobacterales bacterium]